LKIFILGELDPAYFKRVLIDVIVPEFTPKAGVKIQVQENEANTAASTGISFPIINFRSR
jgi:ubiquitin-activating enzyme E1